MERTKHLIATGARTPPTPRVGHADLARVGSRTERGAARTLSGQRLLTKRQMQTRGLEAERRAPLLVSRA